VGYRVGMTEREELYLTRLSFAKTIERRW